MAGAGGTPGTAGALSQLPWLPGAAAAFAGIVVGGGIALGTGFSLGGDGGPDGAGFTFAPGAEPRIALEACGDGATGYLVNGDRVFIVGVRGDQYAIRDIRGGGGVVYVDANAVTPDDSTDALPAAPCTTPEPAVIYEPPKPTKTREPKPTATETSEPTATETKDPGDTKKPSITNTSASPSTVYDKNWCFVAGQKDTATISATVTDNVGVTSVKASWSLDGTPYNVTMSKSGDTYSATFGPVPDLGNGVSSTNETVTITAKDAAGNSRVNTSVEVTVVGCEFI